MLVSIKHRHDTGPASVGTLDDPSCERNGGDVSRNDQVLPLLEVHAYPDGHIGKPVKQMGVGELFGHGGTSFCEGSRCILQQDLSTIQGFAFPRSQERADGPGLESAQSWRSAPKATYSALR